VIKVSMGLLLAFLIGAGCRFFDVPIPGPPRLVGALLVVSMTTGYIAVDKLLANNVRVLGKREATMQEYCGGPTGETIAASIHQAKETVSTTHQRNE
jgi:XapX domain-containing protein